MLWYPKKLKEALLPILILNWITGLGIFEYPLGKPRFLFSFIYLIILLSAYLYVPFTQGFDVCVFNHNLNPGAILLDIMWTYNHLIVIASIIIYWSYRKMLESCIQRIELIDETLECLGSRDNWNRIFKLELLKIFSTIIANSIPVVSGIFWFIHIKYPRAVYCIFKLHIPVLVMLVVDLTFTSFIRCVGFSMEKINILLERAVQRNSKLEHHYPVNRKHHRIISLIMSAEFNSETTEKTRNLIQLLKQLHLELSKVGWDLNKIYGMQITMATITNIIFLILDSYYLFSKIVITENYNIGVVYSLICTTSSAATRFMRIAYLNNVCGCVAKKARRATEIIFELNKGNESNELAEEIEQFAMQIDQRPLIFSMCGLYTLEHKFIGSVLATAVTYLSVMIHIGTIHEE